MTNKQNLLSFLITAGVVVDYIKTKTERQKLQNFYNGWSGIEKVYRIRRNKIQEFNLSVPTNLPQEIRKNLVGVFRLYLFGFNLPTYVMAGRTVELHLKWLYQKITGNKPGGLSFNDLVNWIGKGNLISPEDNLTAHDIRLMRNYTIHEAVSLTEVDILSMLQATVRIIERTVDSLTKRD